ncbi:hypothetical protein BN1318_220018 [Staphylococcus capitis]|nr:hypothetical protein BN1318_220018 [Staphylococcus capitis]
MSRPINEAIVAIINSVHIDKWDFTDSKPAKVRIISEGTTGKTFSNKIKINIAV